MKKITANRLVFFLSFFALVFVVKQYFDWIYILFFLGGLVGLFLPDIDHLLYVFFFKPIELTSQRVGYFFENRQYKEGLRLLFDTRFERKDLIFHDLKFLLVFVILTFWVVSSSGSLFGRGLVLGFWLHLCVFYLKRYLEGELVISSDKKQSMYFVVFLFLLLFIFGLLF